MSDLSHYKNLITASGTNFISVDEAENNDEFHHFIFIGNYAGKEVLFDAILYTLRYQHESEIYELAEQEAIKEFPEYGKFLLSGDEKDAPSEELENELGLFMAEAIIALEDDGEVKVSEHINLDTEVDFGIGFEAGLRIEKITPQVIEKLITEFNNDTLELDETLVTYQTQENDGDEEGN